MAIDPLLFMMWVGTKPQIGLQGFKAMLGMCQADVEFPQLMLIQRFFVGSQHVAIPKMAHFFGLSLVPGPSQC